VASDRIAVVDLGTNSTRLLVADVVGGEVHQLERLVDGGEGGRGPRHGNAERHPLPGVVGRLRPDHLCGLLRKGLDLLGRGRVVPQVALRLANHTELGGDVKLRVATRSSQDELGASAPYVHHESQCIAGTAGRCPSERQPRLLVAG
jgi:hypothetical protein